MLLLQAQPFSQANSWTEQLEQGDGKSSSCQHLLSKSEWFKIRPVSISLYPWPCIVRRSWHEPSCNSTVVEYPITVRCAHLPRLLLEVFIVLYKQGSGDCLVWALRAPGFGWF